MTGTLNYQSSFFTVIDPSTGRIKNSFIPNATLSLGLTTDVLIGLDS